jgi:uncharacterized protein
MAQNRATKVVQFLCNCLKEKGLTINKVILFGSQAKGFSTAESDIDIVIVSEEFRNKNIFKRAELTKDAEIRTIRKFMVPLDIITITPEEYEDRTAINGKIVYTS